MPPLVRLIVNCTAPIVVILILAIVPASSSSEPAVVKVFDTAHIYFAPDTTIDSKNSYAHDDNGRIVLKTLELPVIEGPTRITAQLRIHPIPKDELVVHDKWDRAGNIHLSLRESTNVELVKFITAYGGETYHELDISQLAPLLEGEVTIGGFIDTWVNPAWKIDFRLVYQPDTTIVTPQWCQPLFYEQSFTREAEDAGGLNSTVTVPDGLTRVKLYYHVSGHCTDGRGADEFEPKDNVLRVDDVVVFRCQPWRDDCHEYRAVNPYTRRWSDGMWSSDYSRSGWCPGDEVEPLVLDLTDHLTVGEHSVNCLVENVRPRDDDGHHGYWRNSAYLVGW